MRKIVGIKSGIIMGGDYLYIRMAYTEDDNTVKEIRFLSLNTLEDFFEKMKLYSLIGSSNPIDVDSIKKIDNETKNITSLQKKKRRRKKK